MMALATQSYAGGELLPITEFEVNDAQEAIKAVEVVKVPMAPKNAPVIAPVVEKKPWYVGAGLVGGRVKSTDCEDITYGFMAKIGYDFSDYVGVEARGLRTNWDYEGGKLKHLGAFVKPQYPISKDLNLYGLVGYAKTSFGTKRNFSDTGLAYGAGVDYSVSDDFGLFVDYERLLHDAGVYDLDALALGVSYNF